MAYKKQSKMHHGNVQEMEPFGFVPRMFGFFGPGYCASIVNKTNFKNTNEQHVHVYFDLPEKYPKLKYIKRDVKVVIQSPSPRRQGLM